ncbi:MAG: copper amine oxidase N-terminal domain-containing protein [Epulopiscium sp.]|nr:copper amine oxidase N-terminal domain-containing protein [Candidatus Epulonipiscium sp.]
MNLFKKKKIVRRASIVLAGSLLLGTVVQASSLTKKIDATFKNIKVFSNNQQQTMAQEPFLYNNSVYLPVRAVAELVGKNVEWVGSTNSVHISDKSGGSSSTVEQLQAQLTAKEFEVARLNAELSKLKSEMEALKEDGKGGQSSGNLKETLDYLEKEFGNEYSIYWDFDLTETSSRINVEVSFDSRYDDKRWDSLSKKQRENFFEDICREIRYDFKDTPINGKVLDNRTDKEIAKFSYSTRNSFTYTDTGSVSFSALERDLKNYIKKIDGADLPIDDIELSGTEDDITFVVYVDLYKIADEKSFKDAMKNNHSKVKGTMDEIRDEILDDYRYASIQGYIEDTYSGDTVARYDGRRLYD